MNTPDPDPIVAEVRLAREAHAARFNFDPRAIFSDIKAQQALSGRKFVSFSEAQDANRMSPEAAVGSGK